MINIAKMTLCVVVLFPISGCGNRYIAPRVTNPLIEDRVRMGHSDQQKMSVLTSRADRRTVLVFGPQKVCAEPPPDVAEAIHSQAAVELATKGYKMAAGSSLQTALMQLTRRSQGLEFYRTGAFVHCMMNYNGKLGDPEYVHAMSELLKLSMELAEKEMANLPSILTTIAQVQNPVSVTSDVNSAKSGENKEK